MSSNRMHPPMDVHVPTSWSGSVHSDDAFYSTSSRDNKSLRNESIDSINSVASVAASAASEVVVKDTDSLLSLEESKKQTKFLEELLDYSESASYDSQGNRSNNSRAAHHYREYSYHHTIIDNTISEQADWAHANSASIARERVSRHGSSLVNDVLGFLLSCGCPTYTGNDQRRNDSQQRKPDVFEKIALVGHEGDLLDKIFSGCESAVCNDGNKGVASVDRRENRILGAASQLLAAATSPQVTKRASSPSTQAAVLKQNTGSDVLDSVFESMENMVCRDDLGECSGSNQGYHRNQLSTRGIALTNQTMVEYDILDNAFQGVESLICQDGPRDPSAARRLWEEQPPPPQADYVTSYVRSHRGDWRAIQPGEYSFDRDNSIIAVVGGGNQVLEQRPLKGRHQQQQQHHHQAQQMVKHGDAYSRSNLGGVQSSQNHQDMLDVVFDGVETMVCNDDDDPYLGNRASQFDEDLPLKRFHWDDE